MAFLTRGVGGHGDGEGVIGNAGGNGVGFGADGDGGPFSEVRC